MIKQILPNLHIEYEVYCEECCEKVAKNERVEKIEPKLSYKISGFKNGEEYEKIVSFEEEWQRYLKSIES